MTEEEWNEVYRTLNNAFWHCDMSVDEWYTFLNTLDKLRQVS